MLNIKIILGSTRQNRAGESIAKWVLEQAQKNEEFNFELLDLRDYPLPFYDEVAPVMALNGEYSTDIAKKWVAKLHEADGFIVITPEYNHSFPAVIKNAFDYAVAEWNQKPVSYVSYGAGEGGSRAVEHLRQVTGQLQMAALQQAIHIQNIWAAFDENGKLNNEEMYNKNFASLLNQLAWWGKALKKARENQD